MTGFWAVMSWCNHNQWSCLHIFVCQCGRNAFGRNKSIMRGWITFIWNGRGIFRLSSPVASNSPRALPVLGSELFKRFQVVSLIPLQHEQLERNCCSRNIGLGIWLGWENCDSTSNSATCGSFPRQGQVCKHRPFKLRLLDALMVVWTLLIFC